MKVQGEGAGARHCRPHLADVVPEDGLVVRAPELPLEPGLRLPIVRDLRSRGPVPDLREVRHGVPHSDGPVWA
jgi:hypothetical protein